MHISGTSVHSNVGNLLIKRTWRLFGWDLALPVVVVYSVLLRPKSFRLFCYPQHLSVPRVTVAEVPRHPLLQGCAVHDFAVRLLSPREVHGRLAQISRAQSGYPEWRSPARSADVTEERCHPATSLAHGLGSHFVIVTSIASSVRLMGGARSGGSCKSRSSESTLPVSLIPPLPLPIISV